MQLFPAAAKDARKFLRRRNPIDPDLRQAIAQVPLGKLIADPKSNAILGTCYLGWLRQHYAGSASCALRAYNKGLGNVKRWTSAWGLTCSPMVGTGVMYQRNVESRTPLPGLARWLKALF